MRLVRDLLFGASIRALYGQTGDLVSQVCFDSRNVDASSIFIAIKGVTVDAHNYIPQVIASGCKNVVCEYVESPDEQVNYMVVDDSAKALGIIAANFFDNPSKSLQLIGITGTNGKTTTATLLYDLFQSLGYTCGKITTVENAIAGTILASTHTTPDAVSLNALLAEMRDAGCSYCFMEVSSHAVDQQRIAGLQFKGAVFTNLTHDHLDYHLTFKQYLYAKKMFFDGLAASAFALTNKDDKNGLVMTQNTKAKIYTYGLKSISDFKVKVIENQLTGLVLNIDGAELWTRLIGHFNAYNLLAVYATAILLEQKKEEVLIALSRLASVNGRFEYVISPGGIIVIVDYAHTPDALMNVLQTIDAIRSKNEKVITIVGCGGDRDREKRPKMAAVACDLSDQVILTSDNPRSENPDDIIQEMMSGIGGHHFKKTSKITDRFEAIKSALMQAVSGDILLVAGKGHETYQEIKGVRHDFDDKKVVELLIQKLEK
jgi:UDP-N-acetylmuramoyl-L-alanyl-D-glutamate--2,6-diaminopimelate ligase